MTSNLEQLVINAEEKARKTNLQRSCEAAAREINNLLDSEGQEIFEVSELAAIIYKELNGRTNL